MQRVESRPASQVEYDISRAQFQNFGYPFCRAFDLHRPPACGISVWVQMGSQHHFGYVRIVPESRFARRKWRWFLPGQFDQQRDKFCLQQQRDSSQYDYYLVSFHDASLIDTTRKRETDRREIAKPESARCGIKCLKIHRTQLDAQRTCPGKCSVKHCRCNASTAPFRQHVGTLDADSKTTGYDMRRSIYTVRNFEDTDRLSLQFSNPYQPDQVD